MQYPVRITLPLEQKMADEIDAALNKGEEEARVDLIRVAIAKELAERGRAKKLERREKDKR